MRQVLFEISQSVLIGGAVALGAALLLFGLVLLKQRRPALGAFGGAAGLFVVAFFLRNNPNLPTSIPIYGFGAMLFLAFVSCTWLAGVLSQREGIAFERIQDLSLWIFICGLLGGRINFIISFPKEFQSWVQYFAIWHGGLVFYGSFIGGVVGFFLAHLVFLRKYHISRWKLIDIIAPCGALGLCLGRIGCLLNGCCYGNVACGHCPDIHFPLSSPPRFEFVKRGLQTAAGFTMKSGDSTVVGKVEPDSKAYAAGLRDGDVILKINGKPVKTYNELMIDFTDSWPRGRNDLEMEVRHANSMEPVKLDFEPASIGLHPTQVYESISMALLLLLLVLLFYYPLKKRDGMVFVVFMVGYAVHRFLNEMLRTDTPPVAFGMTQAQNFSIVVLAAAAVLFLLAPRRSPPPESIPTTPSETGIQPGITSA